ncbi:MAG: alanine--tRNA ligase, partial [Terriglobia bacterium]
MTSDQIRSRFLEFFQTRGHRVVRSSSLVPANDPTLLFSNAGMNQFKDVFLGREKRDYVRACSSQKCVRAGGKHNDLEQVGRTARHHTFFEMLGNFSFGDYFKDQAIPWAWELITEGFGIPREKLYVTIFKGGEGGIPRDAEAYDCWRYINVPTDRIFEMGMKENFWQMGETGPCGPCSEIHYDMGKEASELGHADCGFPCDCGRYVELWNLVFMQYDRVCLNQTKLRRDDGTLEEACIEWVFKPLPKPCVDTGAGLERLAAVLQGKLSNFDTDLFKPLIEEAAVLANVEYGTNPQADVSLRIIADHARASTFLISDGVLPSNEGRGYVLRLIMRRALYHGQTLGLNEPFLYKISGHVVELMKNAYPELVESARHVAKVIKAEEERYARTTRVGLQQLDEAWITLRTGCELRFSDWRGRYVEHKHELDAFVESFSRGLAKSKPGVKVPHGYVGWVNGDDVFKLRDTFGLRADFVEDVVKNYGLTIDWEQYEIEMERQRQRGRASWKAETRDFYTAAHAEHVEFVGYDRTEERGCEILHINNVTPHGNLIQLDDQLEIVLDKTPFYAEAGGQVGDTGWLLDPGDGQKIARVTDTKRSVGGQYYHCALAWRLSGLGIGKKVRAVVDAERRDAIRRNHTATHLLHAALRKTLGTHVKQAGSLVAPDHLRFDFTHYAPLDEQDRLD